MPQHRATSLPAQAEDRHDYEQYVADKSVVIVGPAAYLEGSGRGEWIDSHDLVVRLNWGIPETEQVADYGARTDILYKRLLARAMPDEHDRWQWQRAGVQWVVGAERNLTARSGQVRRLLADTGIRYAATTRSQRNLTKELRSSPLMLPIALRHLLDCGVRSVTVTGCDFYASAYVAGYGGQDYRQQMGRPDGQPARAHDSDEQVRWLALLAAHDERVLLDERGRQLCAYRLLADVAVIIPARMQSSRFPRKPLAEIAGVPMVVHVCRRVSQVIERVYVATDSDEIARVVEDAGYRAILTGDCLTGTDRVAEAAKHVDAEIIVNVQGDEPLVEPQDVLRLVEAKRLHAGGPVNGYAAIGDDVGNPAAVKAVIADDGRLIYLSRQAVPAGSVHWRQLGLYAFSRGDLATFHAAGKRTAAEAAEDVEMLRFVELGVPVQMVECTGSAQAVDLPEHIAAVESLMDSRDAVLV